MADFATKEKHSLYIGKFCAPAVEKGKSCGMKTNGLLISTNACKIDLINI